MTTGVAIAPPQVTARPMLEGEKRYVYATARSAMYSFLGGSRVFKDEHTQDDDGGPAASFVHWPTVYRLMDPVIDRCAVEVATFGDDHGILGFVCWSREAGDVVEFLHLRLALASGEPRVAAAVLAALVGERRNFILRRPIAKLVARALIAGGYSPTIMPVAL